MKPVNVDWLLRRHESAAARDWDKITWYAYELLSSSYQVVWNHLLLAYICVLWCYCVYWSFEEFFSSTMLCTSLFFVQWSDPSRACLLHLFSAGREGGAQAPPFSEPLWRQVEQIPSCTITRTSAVSIPQNKELRIASPFTIWKRNWCERIRFLWWNRFPLMNRFLLWNWFPEENLFLQLHLPRGN